MLSSESFAAEKATRFCLKFMFFSFVYFLCVGIPILKIVVSHAHIRVISDVNLLKLSSSCHELSWRSRHGEWVNITPKCNAA